MPSLYLVIFGIIVICAVITLIKPQYDKWLYYGCLAVMTLFLMLRFGQGTDYPGYLCIMKLRMWCSEQMDALASI